MTNPVFEAVRTVLAVREYDDRPIPDDLLRRIVGYPKRQLGLGKKKRRPLADVFSAERFGRPLD